MANLLRTQLRPAIGGASSKLLACLDQRAPGAIVGPGLVVTAFLFTAVAGGVLAVVVAARRRRLSATLAGTGRLVAGSVETRAHLRSGPVGSRFAYGPAIAAGSILAALVG